MTTAFDATKPVTTDTYASWSSELIANTTAVAAQLDDTYTTYTTNPPAGAKRFSTALSKWQVANGSGVWADMVSTYAISISGTAAKATNIAGGSVGTVPYQSATDTTAMLAAGTSGYVFQCNGAAAPSWVAPSSLTVGTAGALTTANNYQVNSLGVGTAGSGTAGEIRATNNVTAYYSDERLKDIAGPITDAIAKVMRLRAIYYRGNSTAAQFGYDTTELQVGVVAQEVQAELPMIVKPAPFDREVVNGVERSKSGEEYLTVQYEKLVPLLLAAIQDLQGQINVLKARG